MSHTDSISCMYRKGFFKETSQSITVNSEGMQVQVNLTPLYMVQVKVNPTGGNVEFTDSEGQKHTGSAGPATYTARFDKIPAEIIRLRLHLPVSVIFQRQEV